MKNNSRLSLADFKVSKFEGKNEVDKMLTGAAACCHWTGPHKSEPQDGDPAHSDVTLFDFEFDRAYVDSNDMDPELYAKMSELFAADMKADPELAKSLGV